MRLILDYAHQKHNDHHNEAGSFLSRCPAGFSTSMRFDSVPHTPFEYFPLPVFFSGTFFLSLLPLFYLTVLHLFQREIRSRALDGLFAVFSSILSRLICRDHGSAEVLAHAGKALLEFLDDLGSSAQWLSPFPSCREMFLHPLSCCFPI